MRYMQVVCLKRPLYNFFKPITNARVFFLFTIIFTHHKEIKISDLAHLRSPAVGFGCTPNVVAFILVRLLALVLHRESPV